VEGYSRQSGIDERNLLRIMGLFELDSSAMITSAGLSDWLNITVRSCNRILSQLLDSGLIEELQPVKKEGRGRPVRQYQFHTDVCRKTFY
jgi:response regulator of citrate/malate metabolism